MRFIGGVPIRSRPAKTRSHFHRMLRPAGGFGHVLVSCVGLAEPTDSLRQGVTQGTTVRFSDLGRLVL
jgi:hypothetical protein